MTSGRSTGAASWGRWCAFGIWVGLGLACADPVPPAPAPSAPVAAPEPSPPAKERPARQERRGDPERAKCLTHCNVQHTCGFMGMSVEECVPFCLEHLVQQEPQWFVCMNEKDCDAVRRCQATIPVGE